MTARAWLSAAAAACALAAPASAQTVVGRVPTDAVMRDVEGGQRFGTFIGWLDTGADPVGVRAHASPILGVRYGVPMAGPMYFAMRLYTTASDRDVFVADTAPGGRRAGTASANQLGFDAQFELALTGQRSWHGVQPLVTGGLGIITGVANHFDAAKYAPGASLTYLLGVGARFHTGRNGELRADAGWMVHQMRYPRLYQSPPTVDVKALRPTGTLTPLVTNRSVTVSWTWRVFR